MTKASKQLAFPAVFAAVLSLAGCAVGPDYQQPQVHLAPFHNLAAANADHSGKPIPDFDLWWTGFNDPQLDSIVKQALTQNLDLAAAFARVTQARAEAAAAGAQLLPTVDLAGAATTEEQSIQSPIGKLAEGVDPGYNRYQQDYQLGADASWEIDLAGGLRRGAAAAKAEMQAAEAAQVGTRITVAADAADAYLLAREYQARLAVAQNQIETDQQLLWLVRERFKAGAAQDREVAQAAALLQQAQATVPPLQILFEAQLNRLDVLLGAQPGTYARALIADAPGIPAAPAICCDDRPADLLRRRPDIIAAERRLAASNERIGAAIADYYPKISLSGLLGFDSVSANHLFTAQAFAPSLSGGLRWRLFDFGKVDAEVAQAKGANAEALADYRQTVLKAAEDVENALMTLSQTEIRVGELQNEVSSLTRARDLSQRAYEAGTITLTDVLDSDRQLLSARDDLDSTEAGADLAAVGTFRALGGGWNVPPMAQLADRQ